MSKGILFASAVLGITEMLLPQMDAKVRTNADKIDDRTLSLQLVY